MKAAGAAFEEHVIELRNTASTGLIKEQSPSGRVPVLHIEENGARTTVFDSLAICETIAERHPEARLWPEDPIARSLARSYAAEMHSGFLALREALPMDFARELPPPALGDEVAQEISRIQDAWRDALSRYGGDSRDGGGFLFGGFSIADCMYAPVVSRFLTYGIPMAPDLRAYADRMMALPAMQEWRAGAQREIANGLPDQWKVDMMRNAR